VHHFLKIAVLLLMLFLLEPGVVAWSGGTPGHHIMGIRESSAISIFITIRHPVAGGARYLVSKISLGTGLLSR
jgi:hypothetical protein